MAFNWQTLSSTHPWITTYKVTFDVATGQIITIPLQAAARDDVEVEE